MSATIEPPRIVSPSNPDQVWCDEEEEYLRHLADACQYLARKYRASYELRKSQQAKFRIPSIIIGSISGVASFGTSTFPPDMQQYVSIVVGGASILIAILNTIESYMKIGELMGSSLQASTNFLKLADDIAMELAIPRDIRVSQGILFLRETFALYQKYLDLAPPIKIVRFVHDHASQAPHAPHATHATHAFSHRADASTSDASAPRLSVPRPSHPTFRLQRLVHNVVHNVVRRVTRSDEERSPLKAPDVHFEIRD